MTEEAILKALSNVQEPDLGKDLVTLNMIKDIAINGNKVSFTIVLTTPACPMKDLMKNASENAIKILVNKEAEVTVNFTSKTTSNRTDPNTVLKGVKNIIAVVSGKGGVGKSTVSANLALALAASGAKVGLMDADIYGPSQHIMFGIRGERPMMKEDGGKGLIVPIEKYGIKVMSIGLLIDEKQAVVWRGPMVSSAIRQFVTEVDWGELDYLVLDMPPGTGDIQLSMVQKHKPIGAVIISTPQDLALIDATRAISFFDTAKVPIIGLVENMAGYLCPHCGEMSDPFGSGGAEAAAKELGIPFLGRIPLDIKIRMASDAGTPPALGDGAISDAYAAIARQVAAWIDSPKDAPA